VAEPRARLSKLFLTLVKPELREEMTAIRQIQALGLDPRDVQHIVLSHLDFDHAGGLDDFPQARVHLLAAEVESATAQRTLLDRMRYRPEQWGNRELWRAYSGGQGDAWKGFSNVRSLDGLPPEILMVPLIGHTLGHAGVAVSTGSGWLLYAADAYFYHGEMQIEPHCTPGLRLYQTLMEKDRKQRLANQVRLRELVQSDSGVKVFCGHDVTEFERLSGRPFSAPATAARRSVEQLRYQLHDLSSKISEAPDSSHDRARTDPQSGGASSLRI